jgi:peptide-methionine (S)-S-oxide reductase
MSDNKPMDRISGIERATFGAGCFWCIEAIYQQLKGVIKVLPGYAGGTLKSPTYREVCQGITGHAEVCQIIYDSEIISFDELLEVFFLIHDPTSLNKQGNDVGTQYRSVIFYHNLSQKETAEEYLQIMKGQKCFNKPITTEITPYKGFYKAEEYHFNYYNLNSKAPYSIYVILPKLEKFKRVYVDKIKQPAH